MERHHAMSIRLLRVSLPAGMSMSLQWLTLMTLTVAVLCDDLTPPTIRNTSFGQLQGYIHTLKNGQQVERFLGVPFAAPPIGDLRFELPKPPAPWSGVRQAIVLPPACLQVDKDYIILHMPDYDGQLSEDCLYLNIYVPRRQSSDSSPMAVLIHVHGGSNVAGMGAMLHADVIASRGEIIVVTMNYRLDIFGFLSAPSVDLQGNYGLYDQTLAFRWVKENIANFGGDPAKVTIQGHSAGSIDVGFHVMSPVSKGLFRYAILLSGSPNAYWALRPNISPDETEFGPISHLQSLGCNLKSHELVLRCLRNLDAAGMINRAYRHVEGMFNFSPVIDKTFVLGRPEVLLAGKTTREAVPINCESMVIGVVRDEGSPTAEVIAGNLLKQGSIDNVLTVDDLLESNPDMLDHKLLRNNPVPPTLKYQRVINMKDLSYYVYKPWSDPDNATAIIVALSDLAGDATFTAPAIEFADLIAKLEDIDLYFYRFEHRSQTSSHSPWMGIPHGEDMFFLFGCPMEGHPVKIFTELDKKVSEALIDMWTFYVKHGTFSHPKNNQALNQYGEEGSYVRISSDGTDVVVDNQLRLRASYMAYWNFLLPKFVKDSVAEDESDYGVALAVMIGLFCTIVPICLFVIAYLVFPRRGSWCRPRNIAVDTPDTP